MKLQDTDISSLKKILELKVKEQDVDKLKQEVNDLHQYTWRQNVQIHGMHQQAKENPIERLNVPASELELPPLSAADIQAVHQLPAKTQKVGNEMIAPVLVCFSSRVTRDAWLEKKAELWKSRSKI